MAPRIPRRKKVPKKPRNPKTPKKPSLTPEERIQRRWRAFATQSRMINELEHANTPATIIALFSTNPAYEPLMKSLEQRPDMHTQLLLLRSELLERARRRLTILGRGLTTH